MLNPENQKEETKELAERAERIQNTISLLRKIACVLAVIAAAFMFFHARRGYNNYSGSRLVTAEVVNVEKFSRRILATSAVQLGGNKN